MPKRHCFDVHSGAPENQGCQHRTGGYLSYVVGTLNTSGYSSEDVTECMARFGWITGPSYIVYGPWRWPATSVLYEVVPTTPDAASVRNRRAAWM